MRPYCLPVFLGLLFVATEPVLAAGLEQSTAGVYGVRTFGKQENLLGAGSGVVIGPGQIVTACSVLAGARTISVQLENVSYGATLEAPDVERNLCLLKVPNLNVPGVPLMMSPAPGFGQKVMAASVSGPAVAVRETTIAGLRAGAKGELARIEASIASDAAATGGGLFDENGRLVGILVNAGSPAETRQQAVPASWILEIRARGATAMANYRATAGDPQAVPAQARSVSTGSAQAADGGSPRVGEVWRYRLTDNLSRTSQQVSYRVDRIENDRVTFNQGARVEFKDGRLDRINTPIGGEFDTVAPPGGWVPADVKVGSRWKVSYSRAKRGSDTSLEGLAQNEETIRTEAGTYRTIRIVYKGYELRSTNLNGMGRISVPYKATVWYAPEQGRVVRFTAAFSNRWEQMDETLELVEHRID